jgi:hypothetical protein
MKIKLSTRARVSSWLAGALLLPAALMVRTVQSRIDTLLANPVPDQDLLYFASPTMVEKLTLGYRSLAADIYWMRTIQYYGRRDEAAKRPVRYKNLAALLEITTTLDPDMVDAYRAGCSFLAEPEPLGAGNPREAIALLERAIARHPDDWRYPFDMGFAYFWYLRDFKKAGEIWLQTSRIAGAPVWMESLAAMGLSRGGAMATARSIWEKQYQESDRADIKKNAMNHLLSIQVAEDLWTLEFQIGNYLRKTGLLPWTLVDLVKTGYIRKIPADPLGTPYQFNPQTGKVELGPQSRIQYIEMPAVYREVFLENLARQYPQSR